MRGAEDRGVRVEELERVERPAVEAAVHQLCSSSGVRAPKLSMPGPTRPEKNGTIPPAWWVITLQARVARRMPEKTSRAMNTEVS